MKIRRFLSCTVFILAFASVMNVYAKDIKLLIEGHNIETDTPPVIMYDRVMLPVRTIFEGVGAELAWDGESKTLTGTKGSHIVVMTVGKEEYTIDGEEHTMSVPPCILNDRVFASARYVAEAFGYTVDWDKDQLIAEIKAEKPQEETTKVKDEQKDEHKDEQKDEHKDEQKTEKAEPSTETTTKAITPVAAVTPSLYNKVKEDLNITFDGYTLGTAEHINRFKIATVNYYKNSWSEMAKTDIDKTFVSYSKTLYDRIISTAKRIDYVYTREKYLGKREISDDCRENKAILKDYIDQYFACETLEECKDINNKLREFYTGIKTKYPEYE